MELITFCPHCWYRCDTHDGANPEAQPKKGDASLCWRCQGFAIYDVNSLGKLFLRKPTAEEGQAIRAHQEARRAQAAVSVAWTPSQAVKLYRGSK